jgi:branched-chain amino acid transport system substrate-binding protein
LHVPGGGCLGLGSTDFTRQLEEWMKRLLYLAGSLGLLASFSVYGNSTFAAQVGSPAQAAKATVRLCTDGPIGVPGDAHIMRGIFNGVELASKEWKKKFAKIGVTLRPPNELNDGKADGSAVDPDKEATNARACLDDSTSMGYIGTLNSSMAQVSEPILNKGGMVMISPANSSPLLTTPSLRSTNEPFTASGRLKFTTYYRVVTTDALQGPAGALYMSQSLGVKKLFVVDDGQTYGVGLAQRMSAFNTSGHLGMTVVGTGRVNTSSASSIASSANSVATQIAAKKPDAVYCGCDEPNAYPVERAARRDGWKGSFVGGDAIDDPSFITFVGAAQATGTYATFIGPPASTTAGGFRARYHTAFPTFEPGPYDALAYDAANIALQGIYKAYKTKKIRPGMGNFARRSAVLPFVRHVKWFGATGITTFDKNGDTFNRIIRVDKVSGSNWAFVKTVTNLPKSLKPA